MSLLAIVLFNAAVLGQGHANTVKAEINFRTGESPLQLAAMDVPQLQAQAESGDATAQLKLARAYELGDGVPKNEQIAAEWYKRAADQGNAEAQDSLGEMYLTGEGVEKDMREAVGWFQKAARQGNASAMFHLGAAYYNGDGVDISDSFSYAWFVLASEAGDQRAVEAVQRADSHLKEQSITIAFVRIAQMYEKRGFMPENVAEATRWWLKAAGKGDHDAQIKVAERLLQGQGIAQDLGQARFWCNEAAKQGDTRGEYCLGYTSQHGMGVRPDAKEARKWYELAARSNVLAIKALAQMEVNGEGGKTDVLAACLLYARLAIAGDKDSLQSLAKLKKEMSAKQWKEVQKQLTNMRIDPAKLDAVLLKSASQ